MKIDKKHCVLPLSSTFIEVLEAYLPNSHETPGRVVILNFKDPGYSAEEGGYHPVEIAIDTNGILLYATDFAYVGMAPFAELAKELDFDFSAGVCECRARIVPIEEARELFCIWQDNFVSYHEMGVYQVKVAEVS